MTGSKVTVVRIQDGNAFSASAIGHLDSIGDVLSRNAHMRQTASPKRAAVVKTAGKKLRPVAAPLTCPKNSTVRSYLRSVIQPTQSFPTCRRRDVKGETSKASGIVGTSLVTPASSSDFEKLKTRSSITSFNLSITQNDHSIPQSTSTPVKAYIPPQVLTPRKDFRKVAAPVQPGDDVANFALNNSHLLPDNAFCIKNGGAGGLADFDNDRKVSENVFKLSRKHQQMYEPLSSNSRIHHHQHAASLLAKRKLLYGQQSSLPCDQTVYQSLVQSCTNIPAVSPDSGFEATDECVVMETKETRRSSSLSIGGNKNNNSGNRRHNVIWGFPAADHNGWVECVTSEDTAVVDTNHSSNLIQEQKKVITKESAPPLHQPNLPLPPIALDDDNGKIVWLLKTFQKEKRRDFEAKSSANSRNCSVVTVNPSASERKSTIEDGQTTFYRVPSLKKRDIFETTMTQRYAHTGNVSRAKKEGSVVGEPSTGSSHLVPMSTGPIPFDDGYCAGNFPRDFANSFGGDQPIIEANGQLKAAKVFSKQVDCVIQNLNDVRRTLTDLDETMMNGSEQADSAAQRKVQFRWDRLTPENTRIMSRGQTRVKDEATHDWNSTTRSSFLDHYTKYKVMEKQCGDIWSANRIVSTPNHHHHRAEQPNQVCSLAIRAKTINGEIIHATQCDSPSTGKFPRSGSIIAMPRTILDQRLEAYSDSVFNSWDGTSIAKLSPKREKSSARKVRRSARTRQPSPPPVEHPFLLTNPSSKSLNEVYKGIMQKVPGGGSLTSIPSFNSMKSK